MAAASVPPACLTGAGTAPPRAPAAWQQPAWELLATLGLLGLLEQLLALRPLAGPPFAGLALIMFSLAAAG